MIPTSILNLFARSPISPLQEHMATVHTCVKELLPFFDAVFSEDWEQALFFQQKISELERKADDLKRDIRLHLPKSLFLPVSRNDILELLTSQDLVANKAKDIAGLTLGRKMQFPKQIIPEISRLLERSVAASKQASKAIKELSDLSEAGFKGAEVTIVKDLLRKLDKIEYETDTIQRSVRHTLFQLEDQLPAVHVMFLYIIIEGIGDLANKAQQIGGRVHLLLAR